MFKRFAIFSVLAVLLTLAVSASWANSGQVAVSHAPNVPTADPDCRIISHIKNEFHPTAGGHGAGSGGLDITVQNLTGAAITDWTLAFSVDPDMTLGLFGSGNLSSGPDYVFEPPPWENDRLIPDGGEVVIGLSINFENGKLLEPQNVILNVQPTATNDMGTAEPSGAPIPYACETHFMTVWPNGGIAGGGLAADDMAGPYGNIDNPRPVIGDSNCTVAVRYDTADRSGGVTATATIFNNLKDGSGNPVNMDGFTLDFYWPAITAVTVAPGTADSASVDSWMMSVTDSGDLNYNDVHNIVMDLTFEQPGANEQNGYTLVKPTVFTISSGGQSYDCSPQQAQGHGGSNFGGTLAIVPEPNDPLRTDADNDGLAGDNACQERFYELYDAIHDPDNAYTDEEGIPYHAVEELNVEAPDYGHVTTSEAFSYMLLLEAAYGKLTGDYTNLEKAWAIMEHTIIPDASKQPTVDQLDTGQAASFAPEWPEGPWNYPTTLETTATSSDPLSDELRDTHGDPVYLMHWLLDVDNTYSYGGNNNHNSVYINTFQRGAQESTWETVPHPSWEDFSWGGEVGFLDIFGQGADFQPQWRYTNAPDADARAVEAVRFAQLAAEANGHDTEILESLYPKAAKMGDWMRLNLMDKFSRPIGCNAAQGFYLCGDPGLADPISDQAEEGVHNLINWYASWGGPMPKQAWNFRIGSSDAHFGYQGPWSTYALVVDDTIAQYLSPTGKAHWEDSLEKQVELYMWLQSEEGAIAGGVTNSWNGRYENALYIEQAATDTTANKPAYFYNMMYDDNPVYHDPGSNTWFGFQVWSMQRMMMYGLESNQGATDQAFMDFLDKWAEWIMTEIEYDLPNGAPFAIPVGIDWDGQPFNYKSTLPDLGGVQGIDTSLLDENGNVNSYPPAVNTDLHVIVNSKNQDVGVGASLARTLAAYSQIPDADPVIAAAAEQEVTNLLEAFWSLYGADQYGTVGISYPEQRGDYERFDNMTYIPAGFGPYVLGDGSTVENTSSGDDSSVTFDDVHWFYQAMCDIVDDPTVENQAWHVRTCDEYTEVMRYVGEHNADPDNANAATLEYHRFWGQVDNAMALVEADDWGIDCGVGISNPDPNPPALSVGVRSAESAVPTSAVVVMTAAIIITMTLTTLITRHFAVRTD